MPDTNEATPTERRHVSRERVAHAITLLLEAIGEDPNRPGLRDTPTRVAKFWHEWLNGEPLPTATSFDEPTGRYVMVEGMRVWSLCEHHLLPFWTDVTVAYVPTPNRVLGLSKFGRIARHCARSRLQLQERLIVDICNTISQATKSESVAVAGVGEHLCMTMRGVEMPHRMVSVSYAPSTPSRPNALAPTNALAPIFEAAINRLAANANAHR